jgi:hypothetical protein
MAFTGAIIGGWAFDVGCWMFPGFMGNAGLRENEFESSPKGRTVARTVKLQESSGKTGGFLPGPKRCSAEGGVVHPGSPVVSYAAVDDKLFVIGTCRGAERRGAMPQERPTNE